MNPTRRKDTGWLSSHWHSRTKTGHVAKLNVKQPHAFASANPADAATLGLVAVTACGISRRLRPNDAKLDDGTPRHVFMPFHWGQMHDEDGCVNALTHGENDPISREPELKFSAVRLEKVEA
jgi:anaerobic selenocysteine-containing dehydrogenase